MEEFNREINYIKNDRLKDNLKKMIGLLPDYFYHIPASSTGKYHPEYALGDGGLLRHTKVVVRIGYELLNNPAFSDSYTDDEKDLMLMAMVMHDGVKSGTTQEKYTRFDHPLLAANLIKDNKDKLTLTDTEIDFLYHIISSHMGPWTKDYQGKEVLPAPTDKYQKFVHLCDYLASKKFLHVNFDNNNNIIE
jgi:23S rRNA maturation-related 3'-5' exoribonuclease YhaM